MQRGSMWLVAAGLAASLVCASVNSGPAAAQSSAQASGTFHDVHVHLTNYIQEGITARDFLKLMGNRVGRACLFGIPLQQEWSHRVSGDDGPTYYLESDSPLYYYSFTDAYIAMQYRALTAAEKSRFDPMITGFNPADMYAADHIRRVLQTFPGVFTGIGEFTIHKEFVSSKVAGDVASLSDPALDRIFDFAAEVGLVTLIHSDIAKPFPKTGVANYLADMKALFERHPRTTTIWAHTGLGRIIQPIEDHAAAIDALLSDPDCQHVCVDISWDEVAKYAVASEASIERTVWLLERHPDRFLFGTDTVAPRDPKAYFGVYEMWDPVWKRLSPATRAKITRGNYERLFDAARTRVRAWEKKNAR